MNSQYYSRQRGSKLVPGCCCLMPNGANVVGIIELVFFFVIVSIDVFGILLGLYLMFIDVAFVTVTAICSIIVFCGVSEWKPTHLLPYIIWKPIWLFVRVCWTIFSVITFDRKMNQQLPNPRRLPKVPGCCCHMPKAANICGIIELVLCVLITYSATCSLLLDFTNFIYSFLLTTGFVAITALCVACLFMGVKRWDCKSLLPYIIWKPIWLFQVWADVIIIVLESIETEQQQTGKIQIPHNSNTTDVSWENSYSSWENSNSLKQMLMFYAIYTLVGIICVYVVAHCYKYMKNNRRPIRQPPHAVCYAYPGVGDLGHVESLPPVPPYEASLNYYPAQPTENLYGGVPADEK